MGNGNGGLLDTVAATPHCPDDRDFEAGMCYKKPREGFSCTLTGCWMSNQASVIGRSAIGCPPGTKYQFGACYPNCPEGLDRELSNVAFCTESCPSGTSNMGAGGCIRHSVTRPAGKIPEYSFKFRERRIEFSRRDFSKPSPAEQLGQFMAQSVKK